MFAKFARFNTKYWAWVLATWVVVAVALKFVAPRWDEVTHDGDFAYLPTRLTSVRGEELLRESFPELATKSSIVLVVARPEGRLRDEDKDMAVHLAEMFAPKEGEKSPVASVMSHEEDVLGKKLISPIGLHGQAVLVLLQLNNEFMAVDNMKFIQGVYKQVDELKKDPDFPAGLQLGVTGSAPIGSDMLWSMKESIDNTELTTIILVIAILLIVYRSPGLVLVPLLSIAASFIVSIDVIALVAQSCELHGVDFQIFKTTQIFIVVILFGAATDYCLFLIARYREELERGLEPKAALEEALSQTGHALTASAMTTILGLGAMVFADFGKYRSGGPTIAMSLVVALLACLTVAPALLRAFGRSVFWPLGIGDKATGQSASRIAATHARLAGDPAFDGKNVGRFWPWLARKIIARPGSILVGSFLFLAIPAWYGLGVPITYDMLAELNSKRTSVQGMKLLEQYFPIGETGPITVLVWDKGGNFDTQEQRGRIASLTQTLKDFRYVDSRGEACNPILKVRSLTSPLGEPLHGARGVMITNHPRSKAMFLSSHDRYAGEVLRFDLICQYDPFSHESMRMFTQLEHWLHDFKEPAKSEWHDVSFDFVGITPGIRDLDAVNMSDTRLVGVLVSLSVLGVLIFLLRRPLISLYLIFTVLFGYFVSLGLTHIIFSWLYGASYQGLDWKLPIFLFVILVAVGEDYNIYLVTRVFEEQRRRGPLEGLRVALIRTGGIITSCGVIMAGTFGSMATGTLRGMIELGFAMALGVLLDTFIIRTILVPAFLALLAHRQVDAVVESSPIEAAASHYDNRTRELIHAATGK